MNVIWNDQINWQYIQSSRFIEHALRYCQNHFAKGHTGSKWALRFGIAVTNPPDRRWIRLWAHAAWNNQLNRSYTPSFLFTGSFYRITEMSSHVSGMFQLPQILPREQHYAGSASLLYVMTLSHRDCMRKSYSGANFAPFYLSFASHNLYLFCWLSSLVVRKNPQYATRCNGPGERTLQDMWSALCVRPIALTVSKDHRWRYPNQLPWRDASHRRRSL